jgi:hypothetical protein
MLCELSVIRYQLSVCAVIREPLSVIRLCRYPVSVIGYPSVPLSGIRYRLSVCVVIPEWSRGRGGRANVGEAQGLKLVLTKEGTLSPHNPETDFVSPHNPETHFVSPHNPETHFVGPGNPETNPAHHPIKPKNPKHKSDFRICLRLLRCMQGNQPRNHTAVSSLGQSRKGGKLGAAR